jgi:hypothetical protein
MDRIQNHVKGGIRSVYDRSKYEADTIRVMETVAAHLLGLVGRPAPENVVSLMEEARKAL